MSKVDTSLIDILKEAKENITLYHNNQILNSWEKEFAQGVRLGQKITPIQKVGVYVPGGKAFYPSTVLMNIIPARIAGVDLPRNKRVEIGLTYIYGIGRSLSGDILRKAGVDLDTRVRDLTESEVSSLRETIDRGYHVEGDLRREVQMNIRRLIDIGCYRGLRHRRNLPVHGQRTRTNARTKRGPKKTVPGRGRRRGMKKK